MRPLGLRTELVLYLVVVHLVFIGEVLQRHGFDYSLDNVEHGEAEFRIRF